MNAAVSTTQDQELYLTEVESLYIEGKLNYRLIFGHPLKVVEREFTYGKCTRTSAYFKPGDIFGLDLWQRAVYVLQAAKPGDTALTVPQVRPAAIVLLEAVGVNRARQALRVIAEIEERVDPPTLLAERYLLTDFRLKACARQRSQRRF
jgi:hypothetical protein